MKTIILVSILLSSIFSFSQIDSTKMKVSINLQTRDIEIIFQQYNSAMETMYDSAKIKFRVPTPPAGATVIRLDSIEVSEILELNRVIRDNLIIAKSAAQNRINTAMRAIANTYLQGRLTAYDTQEADEYSNLRQQGRRRLRRADN